MIAVPPFACAPLACLYHDSDDDQSIYVDTLSLPRYVGNRQFVVTHAQRDCLPGG